MRFASRTCLSMGLSATIAIAALAAPTCANAQDSNSGSDQPAEDNGAATAAVGETEIIVTAQRRDQRLLDVPISVSAFSGAQLETRGITSSSDLAQVTPGLVLTEQSSYVLPFIRGVGGAVVAPGEVGSISTYIDGVYIPINAGTNYQLANIESIQVLKGPQGTLFGRNTAGGAILINTEAPGFNWKGKFSADYGNLGEYGVHGYVNGPVSDSVAISLLANYARGDSYLYDINRQAKLDDRKSYDGRGSVLFKPNDRFSAILTGHYFRSEEPSSIAAQPRNGYLGLTANSPFPRDFYDVALNANGFARVKTYGISGRMEYDFGAVKLTSITSNFWGDYITVDYDSDATPINRQFINSNEFVEAFSQELQLASNGDGALQWLVGGYFSDQDAGYNPVVIGAPLVNVATTIATIVNQKTKALFVDGTYSLGDFELTAGLRYNRDEQSYSGSLNGTPLVTKAEKNWTSLTPRAVLSYKPSRSMLAYASFSKGFKSGLFNQTTFSAKPIDPEKVTAYEIGLKIQPASSFTLTGAAFWYDMRGLQVSRQDPITNIITFQNAASAVTKGFELDATLRPISSLTVTAGLSYLDSRYRRYEEAQGYRPNDPFANQDNPSALGNSSVSIDVSGNRVVRAPKWMWNASLSYAASLGSGGTLTPSATIFSTSSFYFDAVNRLEQKAYEIVNAKLDWELPGERVTIELYGKNLTAAKYFRSLTATSFTDRAIVAAPRTYGVRLRYNF